MASSEVDAIPAQVSGSASRWAELHDESSVLAQEAWIAGRDGDPDRARKLYLEAGAKEADAYAALPADVTRTRGILAISLVSLWTKGGDELAARSRATALLRDPQLPAWAAVELRAVCSGSSGPVPETPGDSGNRSSGCPVSREDGAGG